MSLGHQNLEFGGNRGLEPPRLPIVSKYLGLGLNHVALPKIDHEARSSQSPHGLRCRGPKLLCFSAFNTLGLSDEFRGFWKVLHVSAKGEA